MSYMFKFDRNWQFPMPLLNNAPCIWSYITYLGSGCSKGIIHLLAAYQSTIIQCNATPQKQLLLVPNRVKPKPPLVLRAESELLRTSRIECTCQSSANRQNKSEPPFCGPKAGFQFPALTEILNLLEGFADAAVYYRQQHHNPATTIPATITAPGSRISTS